MDGDTANAGAMRGNAKEWAESIANNRPNTLCN